ncbi:MAG: site-specific DNA-methyltransferase [Actinomycetota bacterium]
MDPMTASLPATEINAHYHSAEEMPELEDGSVRLAITSPPYWNLKRYGSETGEIGQEDYEGYLDRLHSVWAECFRVVDEHGLLIVNVNSRRVAGRFYPLGMDIVQRMENWKLIQHAIWYIPNALPQPAKYITRLFDHKFEDLLIFAKNWEYEHHFRKARVPQKYRTADPRAHKKNPEGRCIGDVIRIPAYRPPTVKSMNYHVAAFPDELVYLMVSVFTEPGDLVLDPFLGSGTTLKVAKNTGRRGIGYEINSDFQPLIEARLDEPWQAPRFEDMDIITSATSRPGMPNGRRRPKGQPNGSPPKGKQPGPADPLF